MATTWWRRSGRRCDRGLHPGGDRPRGGALSDAAADASTLVTAWLALELGGVAASGASAPRMHVRRRGQAHAGDGIAGRVAVRGHGVEVRFALPAGDADLVRFWIPSVAGAYLVESVQVDGVAIDDLGACLLAPVSDDAAVRSIASGALRIDAGAWPPVFELDLEGLRAGGAAVELAVTIRRGPAPPDADGIGEALQRLRDALLLAERGSARASATLARRIEEAAARLGELDARIGDDAARERELLRQAVATLETRLDAASLATTEVGERLVAVQGAVSAEQAWVAPLRDALAAERALAGARHDALHAELRAIRHGIDNVFWRRWLRALRGRSA